MDVRFVWVDVFAETPLTGNPLALVPAADALTTAQMAALAREFNQSETTFVVAPTADADVRLRSFTPGGVEVLGAGHNAMGAWIWLATDGDLDPGRTDFSQQIGDDVLAVRVARPAGRPAEVTMTQSAPRFLGRVDDVGPLADALALQPADLGPASPEVASTGAEHLLVRTVSREAVDRAVPDVARLRDLLAEHGAEGCCLYSTEPGPDRADAYVRFFNPTVGIAEDPATGTAAGPLAALLVRDGLAPDDGVVRVLQGVSLGRPSTLRVAVDGERVELSGSGLVTAEGVLHL